MEPGHLAFSPDGTKLASTEGRSPSRTLGKPAPDTDPRLGHGHGPRAPPLGDGQRQSRLLLAGWHDPGLGGVGQVIRLWEVASGREIRPQAGHRSAIGDAAFTPDGRSIVTVGHDRTIRFWDPATGKEIRQLEGSDADPRVRGVLRRRQNLGDRLRLPAHPALGRGLGARAAPVSNARQAGRSVCLLRGPLARWQDPGHVGGRRGDPLGHGDG